jgi:hypothetical protein
MQLHTTATQRRNTRLVVALSVVLPLASVGWASDACAQDFASPGDLDRAQVDLYAPGVRFGISGVGGGFGGVVDGAVVGLAPRIGVQLDRVLGAYLQTHLLLGTFGGTGAGRIAGFVFNELMVDLTALDRFQVALGPSLDFVWNCREVNEVNPCGNNEARFGGDLRFAFTLGDAIHDRPAREGLVLSLELHPTWLDPEFTWMALFGAGGELY